MRKKALSALLGAVFLVCVMLINGSGIVYADQTSITPTGFDGAAKVYYSSPMSVVHAVAGGGDIIAVGEAGNPKGCLTVYNVSDKSVFSVEIDVATPSKMEIFSDYLFIYDYYNNTELSIYDLSDTSDIDYFDSFSFENRSISDFSIAGNELFLLSGSTVYRFDISLEDGLSFSPNGSRALDGRTISVTALGEGRFASLYPLPSGGLAFATANIDGSDSPEIIDSTFKQNIRHHGGMLYYLVNSEIERYDLSDGTAVSKQLYGGERPLSRHITSVQSLFADGSGVYVLDGEQKKVVKLDHNLDFTGLCLGSYSYEEGRFSSPQNVSINLSDMAVVDQNRVQVFGEGGTQSVILGFTPDYAFKAPSGSLFLVDEGKLYTYQNDESVEIASFENVRDAKMLLGTLYVLTDEGLYSLGGDGNPELLLPIVGGKKVAVNQKTGKISVFAGSQVVIYGRGNSVEKRIDVGGDNFAAIETDFIGNIYLLSQSGIIKIDQDENISEYAFEGVKLGGLCGLAIDSITGAAYFASKDAHELYVCAKEDLGIRVAGDIPEITLPSNPLEEEGDFEATVVEVLGYPSTLFYPFSESAGDEDFYPGQLAYDGELKYIPQGAKLLSIYDTGEYRLVFFEGKLGFILSDNLREIEGSQPEFSGGFALVDCNVYSFPYYDGELVKGEIGKLELVEVLAIAPDFDESAFTFALVRYGDGETGYVCAGFVSESAQGGERPYVEAQVYSGEGSVSVYDGDGESVLFTIEDNETVRIYYYKGDFAFISYGGGFGYVMVSHIAPDETFERQRMGFFMLLGTAAVGIIFWIIKKRHLTI